MKAINEKIVDKPSVTFLAPITIWDEISKIHVTAVHF